jgi:hypothetical protein
MCGELCLNKKKMRHHDDLISVNVHRLASPDAALPASPDIPPLDRCK